MKSFARRAFSKPPWGGQGRGSFLAPPPYAYFSFASRRRREEDFEVWYKVYFYCLFPFITLAFISRIYRYSMSAGDYYWSAAALFLARNDYDGVLHIFISRFTEWLTSLLTHFLSHGLGMHFHLPPLMIRPRRRCHFLKRRLKSLSTVMASIFRFIRNLLPQQLSAFSCFPAFIHY